MNLLKRAQAGGLVGAFSAVIGIAFVLLILGIFQAYSADIMSDVQTDFLPAAATASCNSTSGVYTGCSSAWNISQYNLAAQSNLSTKQSTLTNIAVAVIVIAMLLIAASVVGIKIATG